MDLAIGVFKNKLPKPLLWSFYLLEVFIVSHFIEYFMIHLELSWKAYGQCLDVLHVDAKLFQQHLLKRLSCSISLLLLVNNFLASFVWVYFSALYLVPEIYLLVPSSIMVLTVCITVALYCLGISSVRLLFFGIMLVFWIFCLFILTIELICQDFDWDSTESINQVGKNWCLNDIVKSSYPWA